MVDHLPRRRFLTGVGMSITVPVAGCLSTGEGSNVEAGVKTVKLSPAILRMAEIGLAEMPPRVMYSVDDGPDRRSELMDRFINGGATTEDTNPPLPEARHIYYDGMVYQLSHEVIDETPATRFGIRLDIVQGTVNQEDAVRFEELPEVDQRKLAERGLADGDTIGIGTTLLYTDNQTADSMLVPDPGFSYIVWDDGAEAAWFVDDSYDTTLKTYRYSAEEIDDAKTYGERMVDRFGLSLEDLSEEEQAIIETAIASEDGYAVEPEATPTEAFQSLLDRFDDAQSVHGLDEDSSDGRTYIAKYDGSWYWSIVQLRGTAA